MNSLTDKTRESENESQLTGETRKNSISRVESQGQGEKKSEAIQIESDVPTGVYAKYFMLKGSYKDNNFMLRVVNVRQINGKEVKGDLPSGGEVTEIVENKGDLKGDTQHSSWNKKSSSPDTHSLPRIKICYGGSENRTFKAGKTIANQLFLYKNPEVEETVIPNSGFQIIYTHHVYDNDGNMHETGEFSAKEVSHSIFKIEKIPAEVVAKGYRSGPGSGMTLSLTWKIEEPDPGTLIWKVTKIEN